MVEPVDPLVLVAVLPLEPDVLALEELLVLAFVPLVPPALLLLAVEFELEPVLELPLEAAVVLVLVPEVEPWADEFPELPVVEPGAFFPHPVLSDATNAMTKSACRRNVMATLLRDRDM